MWAERELWLCADFAFAFDFAVAVATAFIQSRGLEGEVREGVGEVGGAVGDAEPVVERY